MRKSSAYARKRAHQSHWQQHGQQHIKLPVNIRFAQHHETDLQLNPHTTLDMFREGVAEEKDWHLLALRLNWGRLLAERHMQEAAPILAAAQEALRDVRERHGRTGRWGISQPEFVAMGEGLNHTDTMQLQCTRRELRDALEAVYQANDEIKHKRQWHEMEAA